MRNNKIVVSGTLSSKPISGSQPFQKPVLSLLPQRENWNFSFKFFNQIEYFGCKDVSSDWFISLLERFKELSKIQPDEFFKSHAMKDSWRYHEINWNSRNIPIKKEDLNWIGKEYLDNNEEFQFFQFHISKANGRVVGFWEPGHKVFNIVLLDPLHNMQPAGGKYQYKVNDASPLSCQYSSLMKDIDDIKQRPCDIEGCKTFSLISQMPKKNNDTNAFVAYLDNDSIEELNKAIDRHPFSKIIEYGVMSLINEEEKS